MFFFASRAIRTLRRVYFIKVACQFLKVKNLSEEPWLRFFVDSYFQAKPFVPNLYQKRNKFFNLIFFAMKKIPAKLLLLFSLFGNESLQRII